MFGPLLGGTLYIHFRGLLPLVEFCQVQDLLCVQVLRSYILAASLHGTPAVDVSQTLRRGTRNGIRELSQRAPPIFGLAANTMGIGSHSRSGLFFVLVSFSKIFTFQHFHILIYFTRNLALVMFIDFANFKAKVRLSLDTKTH